MALLAVCCDPDTIPKPDGLAAVFSGAASNENRTQVVPCLGMSRSCPGIVRNLSGVREADHDAWLFSMNGFDGGAGFSDAARYIRIGEIFTRNAAAGLGI